MIRRADVGLALLLSLASAASVPPAAPEPRTAAGYHAEARELYRRGEFERSEKVLQEALDVHPDDAQLHLLLGMVYRDGRPVRPEEAARELARALELDPGLPGVALLLADALVLTGKVEEAERLLRAQVQARPESAPALRQLGTLLVSDARTAEGTTLLERAAELEPDSATVWLELGRARLQTDDVEGALSALERSRGLDPTSPKVCYNLAQAYQAAGRSEDAEKELAAYADLMAEQTRMQERREFLSRGQRSITLHEDRLRSEPHAPFQLVPDLAALYRETDNLGRGRDFFRELAKTRPIGLVGEALLEPPTGDRGRAWELVRQAQALDPGSIETMGILVELAGTPERREQVRSIVQGLEAAGTAPPEAPLWRGMLALADGRYGEAEKEFEEALARKPDDRGPLRNLAVVYAMTGRGVKALETFRQIAEAEPDDGRAWFNLALTEFRLGQIELAGAHLERALALGEESPQTLNLLARILVRQGERQRAIELLERSLAAAPDQADVRRFLETLQSVDN